MFSISNLIIFSINLVKNSKNSHGPSKFNEHNIGRRIVLLLTNYGVQKKVYYIISYGQKKSIMKKDTQYHRYCYTLVMEHFLREKLQVFFLLSCLWSND